MANASSRGDLHLVADLQLAVEADERAGDNVDQALENFLVQRGEREPTDRVERLEDPEALVLVDQRPANHRAGEKAGFLLGGAQEPRIVLRVVDALHGAAVENRARDALVPRDAKGVDLVLAPARRVENQLAGRVIRQKHGAGLGLHHGARILEDVLDQILEAGEREDVSGGEQQRAIPLLHHCRIIHVTHSLARFGAGGNLGRHQREPSQEAGPPSRKWQTFMRSS